jgi:DNA-binding CsgD family transcriptional regulator
MQQIQPSPYIALTPRQLDVLTDASEGLTNQQSARKRGLFVGTVKKYRGEAVARLNALNITHAVYLWLMMEDAPAVEVPFKDARERCKQRQDSQPQRRATHPWRMSYGQSLNKMRHAEQIPLVQPPGQEVR